MGALTAFTWHKNDIKQEGNKETRPQMPAV